MGLYHIRGRVRLPALCRITMLAAAIFGVSGSVPAMTQVMRPSAPQPVAATVPDIATQLRQNRATSCSTQINAAGAPLLAGATSFDSLSNWNTGAPAQRSVTGVTAQRYPTDRPIPAGVGAIVASPVGAGRCDTVAMQVVPSPLSCQRVRETMASRSRELGQLVGVAVMGEGNAQTLLVPTAAGTCVLVGLFTTYAT